MVVRNVDHAGCLYDRAYVTREALLSLAWGFSLYFLGVAIGGLLIPGENIDLADAPAIVGPKIALAIAAVACLIACKWPSSLLTRAAMLIVIAGCLVLTAFAYLQYDVVRQGGPNWIAGALFRAPILVWVAFEIAIGAVLLMIARRSDLELVREPRSKAGLIGAPPALSFMAGRGFAAKLLFVLAAFLFMLAFMQVTLLPNTVIFMWSVAASECGSAIDAQVMHACLDKYGRRDLFGQFLVWPVAFVLVVLLARWLRRVARKRILKSAEAALQQDRRKPILFLRWFKNDNAELPTGRRMPLAWLLGIADGAPSVDRMLVEEFASLGPTIALGDPDAPRPELGVWRDYATHVAWQTHLLDFASRAQAIVMFVDAEGSDGVDFELKLLSAPHLRAKTLFLAGTGDAPGNSVIWKRVQDLASVTVPPASAAGLRKLGVFLKPDGTPMVACSKRFTRSEYLMTLRWFFRERTQAVVPANSRST